MSQAGEAYTTDSNINPGLPDQANFAGGQRVTCAVTTRWWRNLVHLVRLH